MSDDIVLESSHVTKLYGRNKQNAAKMMAAGLDKSEVYQKTGVTVALWDVTFQVKRGEIFVIIGLSGSGKSTIIRCFNRMVRPTSGHALVEGVSVENMSKKSLMELRRHKVSMVFQNFGLFTHRSVMENVAYGPEVRGVPREQRETDAANLIQMVGLEGWEQKPIFSLSGGMKQRVGIARALANDPEILLMDEPFSALDPLVRRDMQFELLALQRKLGKTVLFITHDINEAFKIGDTVAIMRDGKIIQIATPEEMSLNPANEYVGRFIESANKSQVLSARHVMITPSCLIKEKESAANALREMHREGLSSTYVVDDKMRLLGVLSSESAFLAIQEKKPIGPLIERNIITTMEDTLLSDILPMAAETRYPIAVIDDNRMLKGIVTKTAVIASLL
jgi:glycine betaine/proline transport system ATP-binding protein